MSPASDGSVTVAGRELAYARRGEGRPLLLLGGLGAHRAHWRAHFVEALAAHFDCVLLEHRGTGRSARAPEPFALTDLAEDALGALRALGLEDVGLLGFSLGGAVALELALESPEIVSRVVLAAPAVAAGGPALRTEVMRALDDALTSGDLVHAVRTAWRLNISPAFADDALAFAEWEAAAMVAPMSLRTMRRQRAAIENQTLPDRVGGAEVDAVLVHGTEDLVVPLERSVALAAALGAPLERLDGAGHLFHWEQPARAAALVAEALVAQ